MINRMLYQIITNLQHTFFIYYYQVFIVNLVYTADYFVHYQKCF